MHPPTSPRGLRDRLIDCKKELALELTGPVTGDLPRGPASWPTLLEARVVIGDFKDDHNHRHRHSALGYQTPAEYAAGCTHQHHPVACEID